MGTPEMAFGKITVIQVPPLQCQKCGVFIRVCSPRRYRQIFFKPAIVGYNRSLATKDSDSPY